MTEKTVKTGKIVLFTAGIVLMFAIVFSGCKKDDVIAPDTSSASITPADKGAVANGTTTDLKWSAAPGADGKYNIYFGETTTPSLYKADYASQVLNVPVTGGHTYYWKIGTIDKSGNEKVSPVYSFKVKLVLDLDKFTGAFDCNEPKYNNYAVNATKLGKDTLQIDNFWDLHWTLKYVFDELGNIKIVPKTFAPDPSLTFSVTGTGTYDIQTNGFKINYSVVQNTPGGPVASTVIDQNTHSFVKKQ